MRNGIADKVVVPVRCVVRRFCGDRKSKASRETQVQLKTLSPMTLHRHHNSAISMRCGTCTVRCAMKRVVFIVQEFRNSVITSGTTCVFIVENSHRHTLSRGPSLNQITSCARRIHLSSARMDLGWIGKSSHTHTTFPMYVVAVGDGHRNALPISGI